MPNDASGRNNNNVRLFNSLWEDNTRKNIFAPLETERFSTTTELFLFRRLRQKFSSQKSKDNEEEEVTISDKENVPKILLENDSMLETKYESSLDSSNGKALTEGAESNEDAKKETSEESIPAVSAEAPTDVVGTEGPTIPAATPAAAVKMESPKTESAFAPTTVASTTTESTHFVKRIRKKYSFRRNKDIEKENEDMNKTKSMAIDETKYLNSLNSSKIKATTGMDNNENPTSSSNEKETLEEAVAVSAVLTTADVEISTPELPAATTSTDVNISSNEKDSIVEKSVSDSVEAVTTAVMDTETPNPAIVTDILGQKESPQPESATTATVNAKISKDISETLNTDIKPPVDEPTEKVELTVIEKAQLMKKEAARMKAEAEKLDTILALEKLKSFNKRLQDAKAKKADSAGMTEKAQGQLDDDISELLKQIEFLKVRIDPTTTPAAMPKSSSNNQATNSVSVMKPKSIEELFDALPPPPASASLIVTKPEMTREELVELTTKFEEMPQFLRSIVFKSAGFDPDYKNTTHAIIQMYKDDILPTFSTQESNFDSGLYTMLNGPNVVVLNQTGNEGQQGFWENIQSQVTPKNKTDRTTAIYESLYPTSFRKLSSTPPLPNIGNLNKVKKEYANRPTPAQMAQFYPLLFQSKAFAQQGESEEVPGGFLIRGVNRFENSTSMLDTIETALEDANLRDQLNVFYFMDPTTTEEDSGGSNPLSEEPKQPVLIVTGPDIYASNNQYFNAALTVSSMATIFFLSLYPFLFNEGLMNLLDGAYKSMEAAGGWSAEMDAPSAEVVNYITLQSFVLAVVFATCQGAHEYGHYSMSQLNKLKVSTPTLIPSILTGITTTINRIEKPFENRAQLAKFSLAGPLVGMIVSIIIYVFGLQATPLNIGEGINNLPLLPLGIMQRSNLAVGVANLVMGQGFVELYSSTNESFIPLSPVAIAGFFGMVVNALAMAPYGRSDGGRTSTALFGRSGAQGISFFTSIMILFLGLISNDAILFYFLFVTFFQGEQEIPCRDEVAEPDNTTAFLAGISWFLMLLILLPS